jgi:uncharacterized membrane protein
MWGLAAAAATFAGIHSLVAATGLRGAIVRAIGEGPYRGLFSLASVAGLVWLLMSFGAARVSPENTALWSPPGWTLHGAHLLNFVGVAIAVAGLLSPGPTSVGFEGTVRKAEPARGMLRITRHPFLIGVALWGLGHLLVNPERASILLFAPLALIALFGTASIDRKSAARDPENWARFKAATSVTPFAAIAQGRNRFALGEVWWRLAAGAAVAAALFAFHGQLFGVPATR